MGPPALLRFSRAPSVLQRRGNSRPRRVPDRVSAALGICQRENFLPVLQRKDFTGRRSGPLGRPTHENAGRTEWFHTMPDQRRPQTAMIRLHPAPLVHAGPHSTKRESHRPEKPETRSGTRRALLFTRRWCSVDALEKRSNAGGTDEFAED